MATSISIPPELEKRWKLEAEVYSSIVTLEILHQAHENGDVAPDDYYRHLKLNISKALHALEPLQRQGFNLDEFVQKEELDRSCSSAVRLLKLALGGEQEVVSGAKRKEQGITRITKLPAQTAEFIASCLELIDLIRLESIATVERLLPNLDTIKSIMTEVAFYGPHHSYVQEVSEWIKRLELKDVGTIPKENELRELELAVVRWMNDFRQKLNTL